MTRRLIIYHRAHVSVGRADITFDAEMCLVHVTKCTVFLVPYTLILCFADMCASWASLYLYTRMSHDKKYPGHNLHTEYLQIHRNLIDLLMALGQHVYSIIKMWPSLVIGSLRDLESSELSDIVIFSS